MEDFNKISSNEVSTPEPVSTGGAECEFKISKEEKKITNKINKIKAEIKVLEDILSELETEYRVAEIEDRGTKVIGVKAEAINKILDKIRKRKDNISKIEKDNEVKNEKPAVYTENPETQLE